MKQMATILTFLLISLNGFCDDINYWFVYINDSLVAKCDEFSKDRPFNLRVDNIKKGDKISIVYSQDTPCHDCICGLTVKDEHNQKLIEVKNEGYNEGLTLDLKDLSDLGDKNNSKVYHFDCWEFNHKGEREYTHVLTLTFS